MDIDKLCKVLALAASEVDGEAVSALRRAQALLGQSGLSLADLARAASGRRDIAAVADTASCRALLAGSRREAEGLRGELAAAQQRIAALEQELETANEAVASQRAYIQAQYSELTRLRGAPASRRNAAALDGMAPAGRRPAKRSQISDIIAAYLKDPELAQLSDREIARRSGLSPQTVGTWRRRLAA